MLRGREDDCDVDFRNRVGMGTAQATRKRRSNGCSIPPPEACYNQNPAMPVRHVPCRPVPSRCVALRTPTASLTLRTRRAPMTAQPHRLPVRRERSAGESNLECGTEGVRAALTQLAGPPVAGAALSIAAEASTAGGGREDSMLGNGAIKARQCYHALGEGGRGLLLSPFSARSSRARTDTCASVSDACPASALKFCVAAERTAARTEEGVS